MSEPKLGEKVEVRPRVKTPALLVPWPERQNPNKAPTYLPQDWTRATWNPYLRQLLRGNDIEFRAIAAPAEPEKTKRGRPAEEKKEE